MKNRLFIMILVLSLTLLFSINLINAGEVSLYCLKNGQTLEFSKCNPNMQNYYCDSSLCQICVEKTDNVYCPKNPNICNSNGSSCEYLNEDITGDELPSPYIALLNTIGGYTKDDIAAIEFSFKITEKSYMYQTCELLLDEKSVASKTKPISTSTQKMSVPVGTGPHQWKIKCTKTSSYGGGTETSGKRNLFVNMDEFIPNILLTSPDDKFSTTNREITFSYIFSEQAYNVKSCDLKINNDVYEIISSNLNIGNDYSQTLSSGEYSWSVECSINQETVASESRLLTIIGTNSDSNTNPNPNNNTGGSGGGDSGGSGGSSGGGSGGGGSSGGSSSGGSGGSGCKTEMQCSEWTECLDNKQSRVCSKIKASCSAEQKPEEEKDCLVEENNENVLEDKTSSENIFQKTLAGITGAVVGTGDKIKNNKLIVIGVFIAILILAGSLSYY